MGIRFVALKRLIMLALLLTSVMLLDCECKKPTGYIPFLFYFGIYGSGDECFNRPMGLEDRMLTLIVADYGNNRVVRYYTPSLTFQTKWGGPGTGDGEFDGPTDVAMYMEGVDPKFVYVVDSGNNRIQKFDGAGNFLAKWGTSGVGDGEFDHPVSIAVDDEGYVYVTDYRNNRIQKFDSDGTFILKWGSKGVSRGQFNGPYGVAFENDESYNPKYLYVTDQGNHRVQIFTKAGELVRAFGSYGSGDGRLSSPSAIDAQDGRSYIADTGNSRYAVFNISGRFLGRGGNRELMKPVGVTIDGLPLYVSDEGQHRICLFNWKY